MSSASVTSGSSGAGPLHASRHQHDRQHVQFSLGTSPAPPLHTHTRIHTPSCQYSTRNVVPSPIPHATSATISVDHTPPQGRHATHVPGGEPVDVHEDLARVHTLHSTAYDESTEPNEHVTVWRDSHSGSSETLLHIMIELRTWSHSIMLQARHTHRTHAQDTT